MPLHTLESRPHIQVDLTEPDSDGKIRCVGWKDLGRRVGGQLIQTQLPPMKPEWTMRRFDTTEQAMAIVERWFVSVEEATP